MKNDLTDRLNQKLRNYLESENVTIKEMAEAIGVDPTTFSRKLRGESRWKLEECEMLLAIVDPELLKVIKSNREEPNHYEDLRYMNEMNPCLTQITPDA